MKSWRSEAWRSSCRNWRQWPQGAAETARASRRVSFLKNHVNIASGTPSRHWLCKASLVGRMKKLIDMEALGLTRLAVIMLDMQTDVKVLLLVAKISDKDG
ncbi:hypothetical protein HYC85_009692 [Camellia sinensis]|uniref:Uncharacterized protein n=1 Tax=Camellia sinensis TaxID=4442 RepID=A0A7J7HID0_CAMSI|nr:hypothetical protein HYC85_009692 [Camellia sinensis]